jgi:hypothetical protein
VLKRIIRRSGVQQNPAANAPNQSPVPFHQFRESRFILAGNELSEQIRIGSRAVEVRVGQ